MADDEIVFWPNTCAPLVCAATAVPKSPLVQPVKLVGVKPAYLISSLSIFILPVAGNAAVEATGTVVTTLSMSADSVVTFPELMLVDAMTVHGPATVPLFRNTVAKPVTVEPDAVVGVASAFPIYSPPPGPSRLKPTAVPSVAGLPLISLTRKDTRDVAGWPDP